MTYKNTASQHYLTQEVMTSSPEKLVFMLYDKTMTSLKEAIKAIEDGNIEKRCLSNTKAMQIISHLWQTLDMEKGGEIAANLDRLYTYMLSRLPEVDFKNDPQPALDVIKLLEPLHSSWKELAMKNPTNDGAAAKSESAAKGGKKEAEPALPKGGVSVSA